MALSGRRSGVPSCPLLGEQRKTYAQLEVFRFGPRPDIVRGGVENDSFQPVRLAVPARWCLLD